MCVVPAGPAMVLGSTGLLITALIVLVRGFACNEAILTTGEVVIRIMLAAAKPS